MSRGVHVGIAANHNCSHNQNHNTMASKRSTNTNMTNEVQIALCEHKKATEALQCASLLQRFWMQQDIIDHEMLAGIQTVKDKISIMRSSKLVQKPISEYFSKV